MMQMIQAIGHHGVGNPEWGIECALDLFQRIQGQKISLVFGYLPGFEDPVLALVTDLTITPDDGEGGLTRVEYGEPLAIIFNPSAVKIGAMFTMEKGAPPHRLVTDAEKAAGDLANAKVPNPWFQ
jgi:hypothetical protein